MIARNSRHHDHRRRPHRAVRAFLRRHAPRVGADRRRAAGAGRAAHGALSREADLRRRRLSGRAGEAAREVARRAGGAVRRAGAPRSSSGRSRGGGRPLRARDGQGAVSVARDRDRGGDRRVLAAASSAGVRATVVRPRDPRHRDGSGDLPRQARRDHRRRRFGVRLGDAAARARDARDAGAPQRPIPRARGDGRAVHDRRSRRGARICSRSTSCTTSSASRSPTSSRTWRFATSNRRRRAWCTPTRSFRCSVS